MNVEDTSALIAIRHAPVEAAGLCYGRYEVRTIIDATEAAGTALPKLVDKGIHVMWSSPSNRCRGLARVLAGKLGAQLRVDERIAELHYGRWEGRPWSRVQSEEPNAYRCWLEDWQHSAPHGGESARDLARRVGMWLAEANRGCCSLSVTHAGVIRALYVLMRGVPWSAAMGLAVPYLDPLVFPLSPCSVVARR